MFRSAVAALLVLSATSSAQEPKEKVTNYFPTEVGTKWEYEATLPMRPSSLKMAETREVTEVNEKDGVKFVRIATTQEGSKRINSHRYKVTPKEVWLIGENGKDLDPPLLMLKLPLQKGDTWEYTTGGRFKYQIETVVGEPEEITMQAGKYSAVVLSQSIRAAAATYKSKIWYVNGIGQVQATDSSGGVCLELKSFTPGPSERKKK